MLSDQLRTIRPKPRILPGICAAGVALLLWLVVPACVAAATPANAEVLQYVFRYDRSPQDKAISSSLVALTAFFNDGQMYYVPKSDAGGYTPLYQRHNRFVEDHMPSNDPNEAAGQGYANSTLEAYLYPDGSRAGTEQIARAFNPSTGDYALIRPGETLPGFNPQPLSGYAYPRYGKQNESLLELSDGGVTIGSNRVAGGSLWEWTHRGKQYVNVWDYGRQIQSAYFDPNYEDAAGSFGRINPTEAGSRWSFSDTIAERQGSPLIKAYNSGSTQVTRAVPLEWHPEERGGSQYHPVAWTDMVLGKNITLNYEGMGSVARYETVLVAPVDSTNSQIEIPTGYLRAEFGRFWSYDAATADLIEYPLTRAGDYHQQFSPASGFGGVILSDSTLDYAMGVYGALTSVGGSIDYFTLWNFIHATPNIGAADGDTTKFAAVYGPGEILADHEYTFTTWLMTGSLDEVTAYMDALYARGELGEIQIRVIPEPTTATLAVTGSLALLGLALRKRRARRRRHDQPVHAERDCAETP